jgi:hypothetical protein
MRALLLVIALVALADASPPPLPRPAEIWDNAVAAARAERTACHVAGAVGDVVVELRGTTWSSSPSKSLGGAGPKIAACVKDAIGKHLRGYTGAGDSHTETIGTVRVVLPEASKVLAAWRRRARDELARLLPPDHSLTKDLCISADRKYAATAMMLWMPTAGPWVPRMWEALLGKMLGDAVNPVIWDPAGGFITQGQRGLCYVPMDAAKQTQLRAQMDTLGSCWQGTFEDVLLHPHVAFPTTKKYMQVSTNHGRACALDIAGNVTCCGRTEPALPAAPTGLVSIATGFGFACGIDKKQAVRCWGAISAPPTGTFKKISAEYQHACAVATDGTLACWGAGNYNVAKPPAGTFVDVAAAQFSTCGIRKGRVGPVLGRGAARDASARRVHRRGRELDTRLRAATRPHDRMLVRRGRPGQLSDAREARRDRGRRCLSGVRPARRPYRRMLGPDGHGHDQAGAAADDEARADLRRSERVLRRWRRRLDHVEHVGARRESLEPCPFDSVVVTEGDDDRARARGATAPWPDLEGARRAEHDVASGPHRLLDDLAIGGRCDHDVMPRRSQAPRAIRGGRDDRVLRR